MSAASTFSRSITALILLRLDARVDEWVSVAELASHMAVAHEVVRQHIEVLDLRYGLMVQRINGLPVAAAKSSQRAAQCV